jgi:hypothetical protein
MVFFFFLKKHLEALGDVTTLPHKEIFLEIRVLVKEALSWNRDEQARIKVP